MSADLGVGIVLDAAILAVMALADWTRGSAKRPKWAPKAVCLLIIGLCVAFLLGNSADLAALAIAILIAIGGSVGMGNALGPALRGEKPDSKSAEWWQKGPLLKNTWLSLAALGFLWGAPALLALPWVAQAWVPAVAFTLATPLAAWLAISSVGGVVHRVDGHDPSFGHETARSMQAWARFNMLRSPLAGLFIVAILETTHAMS